MVAIRSESIGVQHRLPIGENLVTVLTRPSAWPSEFKDIEEEYDPDEEGRRWRKQIEAALRMYPRNTWGPTTKWGTEVPGNGTFKEKEHYKESNSISNHVSKNFCVPFSALLFVRLESQGKHCIWKCQ